MVELVGRFGSDHNAPLISLSSFYDAFPVPIIVVDNNGYIRFINTVARRTFGLNDSDLGKTVPESFDSRFPSQSEKQRSSIASIAKATEKALKNGYESTTIEIPLGGNESKTFNIVINPLKTESGEYVGCLIRAISGVIAGEHVRSPLEILAHTSSDIVDNADLSGTISSELGKLTESLNLDFAIFRLSVPDGKTTMICHGIDYRWAREVLETNLRADGPLYESVMRGDLFVSERVDSDPRIDDPPHGIHSLVCLTVRWMKKNYGCAVFGSMLSGSKISSHIPVLQVFCNQVAISLRNDSLWKELAERNTELRGLYETSRAISDTLELREVLMTILNRARSLVNAGNCSIFSIDDTGKKLRCIAYIGEMPELTEGLQLNVGEGITGLVAQSGDGMLIERADLDNRSVLIAGTKDEPSSLISVPLKISEKTVGVMTLERMLGSPFTQKEYQLIEMFSVQAATAINNASMYAAQKSFTSNLQMYNILLTHDVANFNVPIHSYLEMLIKDPKLDDRQRRYVWNALLQSENISDLVTNIRELARLQGRMGDKPLEPMDLIPVINEVVGDIQANPLYGEVETNFLPSVEKAMVDGDSFVKSLFYNVISNACKHGGGGEVEVRILSRDADDSWRIEIADSGKGIPDDRKKTLFKRFDQLEREQGADGHGIGLSVVSSLCDRYSGKVWVEDRVPGDHNKGSVFIVMLPKSRAENQFQHSEKVGGELSSGK